MRHDLPTTSSSSKDTSYHKGRVLDSVIITEIYRSVQGESSFAGKPCTFIRLTGCPLRCKWCDTAYGFEGGTQTSFSDVLQEVATLKVPLVEITGGEPLAQPAAIPLMRRLLQDGYDVLLETSGSEPLKDVPQDVHIIMDLKCPDSKMSEKNRWDNLEYLKPSDEIKFVIASRADFDWAVEQVAEHQLAERFSVLVSPAFGLVKPDVLVEWLLACPFPDIRLNLQLHKFIWHPRAKGV